MAIETEVLIVGAGPTGLMLGCELRRHGVDCIVVDKAERIDRRTRAVMVHAASLEQLEALGLRTEIESRGVRQRRIAFYVNGGARFEIDFSGLDTRYPYYLNIPQPEVEEVLAAEFRRLGGSLLRGVRYDSHQEQRDSVAAFLESAVGPVRIEARFLVGADGASSAVRINLGVDFPGVTYPMSYLLAEGRPEVEPDPEESAMYVGEAGAVSLLPLPDGLMRVAGPAAAELLEKDAELSIGQFQNTVDQLGFGSRLRLAEAVRVAQYQVHERLAERFRVGRVLLAGDAAHLNSPAGGQAMNTGFGDAAGLAWRLGQGVRYPELSDELLDGYARERRAAAAAVARSTGVLPLLDEMRKARTEAEQALVQEKLSGLAKEWSQLYLTYPAEQEPPADAVLCQGGHQLVLGARLPGPAPATGQFTLLAGPGRMTSAVRCAPRLQLGAHADTLTAEQAAWLPPGATAVLVRPDRHVSAVIAELPVEPPTAAVRREEVPA